MNNPKFYIYGVPDGFNMLSGTPDEILYYQLFYDTSKRGREMRINRKANGETVYSYLIYNLVSCKGREGAFLGMSIAFSGNEYCNDPVSLKELFEGVYNEVILKADDKDKIIDAIDGGKAVGRFCISKFDERQDMCDKIGRIIVNNVVGELASSISTIDASFDNSKEGRILTLPFEAKKANINQALRNYTWISLSSEYESIPVFPEKNVPEKTSGHRKAPSIASSQDLLSVHFINELTNKVGSYKDFIIQGLKGLVSIYDITAKRGEINHYLDTIEEYIGRQPVLGKLRDDYMSIHKELVDLEPSQQKTQLKSKKDRNSNNDWLKKMVQKNLSKIIACAGAILVVLVLAVIFYPTEDDVKTTSEDSYKDVVVKKGSSTDDFSTEFDGNRFKSLLESADYKAAWSMLQKEKDEEKRKNLALALQNSYRDWFNNELSKREKDLQGLLELRQKIATYVDFNEDNERHINLLNESIESLNTQIAAQQEQERQGLAEQEKKRQEKLNRNQQQIKHDNGSDRGGKTGVIKIYQADNSYNKGEAISPQNKTINCKRGSCFVVEGATLSGNDQGIEAVSDNDNNRIKIRAMRVGSYKVKLNKIEYTFKVTL